MMKLEVAWDDGSSHASSKVEAVRLVRERGMSVAQASRDLDVCALLAQAMTELASRGVTDPRELRARGFMVDEYSFPHIIKDCVRSGT